MVTKKKLAMEAINIEQSMIKENVGSQDQVIVSFGGLNKIEFSGDHNIEVWPVILSEARTNEFEDHLLLFFTGFTRIASDIAKDKISCIPKRFKELKEMHSMTEEGVRILTGKGRLEEFGKLLDQTWRLKKTLSDKVSNADIDTIYKKAINAGAIGGKLLGAGGGGFILFIASPEKKQKIIDSLKLLHVPFKFDKTGSQIVYYSQSGV